MKHVLAAGEANLTPKRTAVVHCWIPAELHEQLRKISEQRRMHPDRLAADILIEIVARDAIAAVLGF